MEHYRAQGIEPLALIVMLARLGTADPVEPLTGVEALIETFDFSRFGRAIARFDEAELRQLNARILHHLEHEQVRDRLPAAIGPEEWLAIRGNIETLADVDHWHRLITGPVMPVIEAADFVACARESLAGLAWGPAVWRDLTEDLKVRTGRKGKDLFLPLRLALTGEAHGPNMAELLPLIGRDRALARLGGMAA